MDSKNQIQKREIKFRAWNEGKMVDLLAITPLALDANMNTQLALKGMSGLFLPFGGGIELMQFTGLLDKNGKEIFEGDIVQTLVNECTNKVELKEARKSDDIFIMPEYKRVNKLCQIDWFNGVRVSGWRLLGKDKRYQTQLKWSTIYNMHIEVIGNIYENPDLL